MPVQINEVVIRAVVDPGTGKGAASNGSERPVGGTATEAEMVEKVLEIIKEKGER